VLPSKKRSARYAKGLCGKADFLFFLAIAVHRHGPFNWNRQRKGMSSLQHLFRWNGCASLSVTDRIAVLRYESAIKELRCLLLLTKNLSRLSRLRST
jgi:hypothetical protein